MVEFGNFESNFGDDRITEQTFLSSVNSWHKEDGVELGVERCSCFTHKGQWSDKIGFAINCSILDDMPKCRARVLDSNGKAQKKENEMGELVDDIEIIDSADQVTLFLSFIGNKLDENKEPVADWYRVTDKAAPYKVLLPMFKASGLIPNDAYPNFINFTEEDVLNASEGWTFKCKVGKNKNGKLIPIAEVM